MLRYEDINALPVPDETLVMLGYAVKTADGKTKVNVYEPVVACRISTTGKLVLIASSLGKED
jgi:hypothetical protein